MSGIAKTNEGVGFPRVETPLSTSPQRPLGKEGKMEKWKRIAEGLVEDGKAHDITEQMEVPGGWLYRTAISTAQSTTLAMCFVPKPPEMSLKEELEESAKALNLPPADQNCSLGG